MDFWIGRIKGGEKIASTVGLVVPCGRFGIGNGGRQISIALPSRSYDSALHR